MTTKTKLAKLNELHTILGRKHFKVWKESTSKLDARIAKAQAEVDLRNVEVAPTPVNTELGLMIDRYNEHRKVMGYKQIKEWQGTRDELASAITKLKADHLEMIRSEEAHKKSKKRTITIPAEPRKAAVERITRSKAPKASDSFLPGLAAELGMNPKVARTKLRKAFADWKTLTVKQVREFLTKKGA